jgi:hypothetical protein
VEYGGDLSIVVPVFNEVGNLEELYSQLTEALHGSRYELPLQYLRPSAALGEGDLAFHYERADR